MFSHEPFVVLFYLLAQIHDDCWQQACFARSWKFISLSYVAKKMPKREFHQLWVWRHIQDQPLDLVSGASSRRVGPEQSSINQLWSITVWLKWIRQRRSRGRCISRHSSTSCCSDHASTCDPAMGCHHFSWNIEPRAIFFPAWGHCRMMRKMFSSVRLYVAVPKNPLHDLSIHIWSLQVGATMPSFSTPIKQAGEVAWHHTYAFLFVSWVWKYLGFPVKGIFQIRRPSVSCGKHFRIHARGKEAATMAFVSVYNADATT